MTTGIWPEVQEVKLRNFCLLERTFGMYGEQSHFHTWGLRPGEFCMFRMTGMIFIWDEEWKSLPYDWHWYWPV